MMMILFVILIVGIGAVLWFSAPVGFVVHAARSKDVLVRRRRFPLAALYRDTSGQPIDIKGKFLGLVKGDSCVAYGLRDGDIVIAKQFCDFSLHTVQAGDLVIINSVRPDDSHPLRFRKVRGVCDNQVDFYDDPSGALNRKPLSDVMARVESVGSF
jgi:hypothetical protein